MKSWCSVLRENLQLCNHIRLSPLSSRTWEKHSFLYLSCLTFIHRVMFQLTVMHWLPCTCHVSWNTVSSPSCKDGSQPPCYKTSPGGSKGSCRWGMEHMENMSGGIWIRPHCLARHLLLETGTSGRDLHSSDLSGLHVYIPSSTLTNYRFFLIVPNGTGYLQPRGCFPLCEHSGKA